MLLVCGLSCSSKTKPFAKACQICRFIDTVPPSADTARQVNR
jgi:hypothetical protein